MSSQDSARQERYLLKDYIIPWEIITVLEVPESEEMNVNDQILAEFVLGY